MEGMRTFIDFEKEISLGKVKPVYFITASDNYFIKKSIDILKNKMFGKVESSESSFLKYADDSKYDEVLDLCQNFASLFSSRKLIIVKRCEKYSRNLKFIFEYSAAPDPDTVLMLVFDKEYVIESKLWKECAFYDFSEFSDNYYLNWIKGEFVSRRCM